jgi:hypothetical protein
MTNPIFERVLVHELALRVLVRSQHGDWTIVLADNIGVPKIAESLATALEELGNIEVARIDDAAEPHSLISSIREAGQSITIAAISPRFTEDEWRVVDHLRSWLEGISSVILILPIGSINALARGAPNLVSWVGGDITQVQMGDESEATAERQHRLAELRRKTGLSDHDVIVRAEQGLLPPDPEFAEWLVFLGRGDLLER